MAARLMVMAGGTGGHVFPALAVAEELQARGWEVSWLGTRDSFEARVVPKHGFTIDWIDAHRLRGQGVAGLLLAPFRLIHAMFQAWRIIRFRKPQLVLGMGGFVTGPGGLVSRLVGLPLIVHEQNAIPGLTNRWLARVATRVLEAFPGSFPETRHARTTGNPVRKEIADIPGPEERLADHQGPCRVLVIGGSLGAAALNETIPAAMALLPKQQRPVIRHQAGRGKDAATTELFRNAAVEAVISEFIDDMAEAYSWADLVICRAGAITVTELTAAGIAAVLVPYPYAVDDHQTRNAEYLQRAGAARLVPQHDLTANCLAGLISELCGSPDELMKMSAAARQLAQPDAAHTVATICEEVLA